MTTRVSYTKLGIFVLVVGVLTAAMIVAFVGGRFWEETNRYRVRVPESIEGLDVGAAVKVLGVRVGQVERTRLGKRSDHVEVVLSVDPETRIPEGAKAYLARQGVTGVRFVDIQGGDPDEGFIEPGSHIEYGRTVIDQLADRASQLVDQVADLIDTTNRLLTRFADVSREIDPERVDTLLARGEAVLWNLQQASQSAGEMIEENRPPVRQTTRELRDAMRSVDRVASNMTGVTEQTGSVLARLDATVAELQQIIKMNQHQISGTLSNLRNATQSFEDLGRELRRKPSRLFFGRAPEERELP